VTRIDDMTDAEVAQLSEEQIQKLIDLECAEEGIPLTDEPISLPPPPMLEADTEVFEVSGNFAFASEDDARSLAKLVNGTRRLEIAHDWKPVHPAAKRYINGHSNDPINITVSRVMSLAQYERCKVELAGDARAREVAEAQRADHKLVAEQRAKIESRGRDECLAARARTARRAFLRGEFDRYLELADNDRTIAMRFFEKAYSSDIDRTDRLSLRDELLGEDLSHLRAPR
jgi:hypothetical protein